MYVSNVHTSILQGKKGWVLDRLKKVEKCIFKNIFCEIKHVSVLYDTCQRAF